ncbi:MAG: polyhydroxybutyrate depolymerase [Pseudomonadota bacterium]
MPLFLFLFALLILPTAVPAQTACTGQIPCQLGERSYHVREPDGWDGVSPLPVMLHFHGWARQGTLTVRHPRIATATAPRGVLLLAPNGVRKTWDFWDTGSADVPFARAVLEDAATRYPIDRTRIFVSGYSYGSAMAWRFVCEDGADVHALLAVSGTLRQDEGCATHPANVRHVHGTSDTVMRFPFGAGGDVLFPVALWRERMGCAAPTGPRQWNAREFLTFERTTWATCRSGQTVALDVHPGGHFIPHDWFAAQLDELLAPPS